MNLLLWVMFSAEFFDLLLERGDPGLEGLDISFAGWPIVTRSPKANRLARIPQKRS